MSALQLSKEQEAIRGHPPTQHARVLAGPGAGKSFTAVAYLEHLATTHPNLATRMITFTRAASDEFARKLGDADLAGLGVAAPATIHSFALSILMQLGAPNLPSPLRIPDSWELKNAIRPLLATKLRALGHRATTKDVEKLEREMAAGWESMDPTRDLLADENPELGLAYRGAWAENRTLLGYTLLAELPYRAGVTVEDFGGAGLAPLDLLLVDEYQDLNEADIRLVQLLANEGISVVAIGDDDQSIYGWRMAAPEGIRRFCQQFGTSADYPLTLSRRCGSNIISAANQLIQTAPDREAKPVLRSPSNAPPGTFAYLRFKSTVAEARGLAGIAQARIDEGVSPDEIIVLVRSRPSVWRRPLEKAFGEANLELANSEWVTDALGEEGIRRAIAIAQLTQNGKDSLAWLALTRHLTAGVGDTFVNYILSEVSENETFGETVVRLYKGDFPEGPVSASAAKETIREVMATLDELNIEGASLDDAGWGGWVRDNLGTGLSSNAIRLLEMVGEAVDPSEGLRAFLSQLEPLGRDLAAKKQGGIRLMSIGQSKGLTANTVMVVGVERELIPMPPPRGQINEERRLLYVALTRATDMCVMTWAGTRQGELARQGTGNVGRRMRSPLLDGLPISRWEDGQAFVQKVGAAQF